MLYTVHDINASAYRTLPVEMFLPFDHVAFVSQWSLYTRNEKYTEIVLSIEFAVTNGLNTL